MCKTSTVSSFQLFKLYKNVRCYLILKLVFVIMLYYRNSFTVYRTFFLLSYSFKHTVVLVHSKCFMGWVVNFFINLFKYTSLHFCLLSIKTCPFVHIYCTFLHSISVAILWFISKLYFGSWLRTLYWRTPIEKINFKITSGTKATEKAGGLLYSIVINSN